MVTRTYRLDHDLGFAPNPFFGWCSLACCMGDIRKYADLNDIIIGIAGSGPRGLGRYHPQLIYWMRVDETRTFDQYWNDPRFAPKRPQIPGPKMRMVGDTLTDNDHDGDGYRFHDVMHVAFAVHLGWSPNLRAFMGRKRRSSTATDRVEDGGRAKILEEAVILEIHLRAEAFQDYFRKAGKEIIGSPYAYPDATSFEFLRRLHDLCVGHEVYDNPKQDWANAIRDGYDCYHKLRTGNGGIVAVDIPNRKLTYAPLPVRNPVNYRIQLLA